MTLRLALVLVGLVACSCSGETQLIGEQRAPCVVSTHMDAAGVLSACGLPDGLMEQPKAGGGGFFSFELCSAPAYVYDTYAVLFGCDGTVASVERLDPNAYQGLLTPSTSSLLEDIKLGSHVAARIAQLQRHNLNAAEVSAVQQVLREAASGSDPLVKRAALRAIEEMNVR